MKNQRIEFDAEINEAGGGGAYVNIPFDVEEKFGKKRVKVKAEIEGIKYRGTLVRMGNPCHMLPVLKEIRNKAGKKPGDMVHVTLEEDIEERIVVIPDELKKAFMNEPEAGTRFEKLSYTSRKEYARWIEEAKRPETKQDRLLKTLDKLRSKS